MKRLFLLMLLFSLPIPSWAWAWNLADHRDLSRLSVQEVAADWGLDRPVPVHPLKVLLQKLQAIRPELPELGDPWHLSSYLQVNPSIDLGHQESYLFPTADLKGRKEMTPAEILTYYSTDPDDGRDQDLFVRDAEGKPHGVYRDQKWFGFIIGVKSQAFRHIEKPPFSLAHPVATFGFPLRKVGEASRRAEIYHQAALLAFSVGEDYWGWRFLANAFHYLEDLHQPYHSGQITPDLLKKGLQALFSWGWKEKGLMGTFAHIVSNSHRFFESYVDQSAGRDEGGKKAAENAVTGKDVVDYPGSFELLAIQVRDASNLVYGPLTEAVAAISVPQLVTDYEFHSDEAAQDDPTQFLQEGPAFSAANQKLFQIVEERFASAGRVLRTAVQTVLEERKKGSLDPKEILSTLDKLLGPSPLAD